MSKKDKNDSDVPIIVLAVMGLIIVFAVLTIIAVVGYGLS